VLIAVPIAVETWNFSIPTSSTITHGGGELWKTSRLTWDEISRRVNGAGLTSVMSCPAADAMSEPADWMAGCMRGASVSRLKVESGDGKVKQLAVVTCSICSIEDCIMLARAFNSAMAFCGTLPRRVKLLSSTARVMGVTDWEDKVAGFEREGLWERDIIE
jgi:hypothetical protein